MDDGLPVRARYSGLASAVKQAMLVSAGVFLVSANASALNFEVSDDFTIDWDTHVRYSAGWRTEDQNSQLLANINGDDGNRAFDKGELIQNRFDLLTEADFQYKNVGFFVRGRAYYDDVYQGTNDNDSPLTSNNLSVAHNEFTKGTREEMGENAEILDHFVYGNFDLGDRAVSLRVGDQVVSWGESLLILGGVASSQVPLDATKLNIPGVELREVFLPVGTVYGQIDLTSNASLEAYYQYEWDKTRIDQGGSYFSTTDMLDEGGESLLLAPGFGLPRGADIAASDSGQWGVALRYLAEELNGTEFSLFYTNYHDKAPQLNLASDFSNYFLSYEEDIHLWGASFGTVIGDTNVAGEIDYRSNAPVSVPGGPLGFMPQRAKMVHAMANAVHIFGANPLMDNLTLIAEVAADRVLDMDGAELTADKTAWSYSGTLTPEFLAIASGLDLAVPISFTHNVNGKSAGGNFTEGKNKLGIKARFRYLNKYEANISYTAFLGKASENNQVDRDFIGVSFKTSF